MAAQKMIQDKMVLLNSQSNKVINHVSSLVQEAEKSTQKFMGIPLESKKFMKRFQEANNAIETALTSLIRISNAIESLNDDDSSDSESDEKSSRLPPHSPPSLVGRKGASKTESAQPSSLPREAETTVITTASTRDSATNKTGGQKETGSTCGRPMSPLDSGSAGQTANCLSEQQQQPIRTPSKTTASALSVNITVGSAERTVSLSPPGSLESPRTADLSTTGSDCDSRLNPSVKAFLEAAACTNVGGSVTTPQNVGGSVPGPRLVDGPITDLRHLGGEKSVSHEDIKPAMPPGVTPSTEKSDKNESGASRGETNAGTHRQDQRGTVSRTGNGSPHHQLGVPQQCEKLAAQREPDLGQQKRQNMKEIATHCPPQAKTKSNNLGPMRNPTRSPLRPQRSPRGPPSPHPLPRPPDHPGEPSGAPTYHQPAPSPTPSQPSSIGGSGAAISYIPGVTTRSPLLNPHPGDVMEVMVTHIVSPSLFWVQETHGTVHQFLNDVGLFYCQANIPVPEAAYQGLICCAKFSQDQSWYRAQVVHVHPPLPSSEIKVDVYFIDYGNSETVSLRNIRLLHKHFYQVPPLAMKCGLAQVAGTGEGGSWPAEMVAYFNSICLSRGAHLTVVRVQDKGLPLVKLAITEQVQLEEGVIREEVKDIGEILIVKGLARPLHPPMSPRSVAAPKIPTTPPKAQSQTVKATTSDQPSEKNNNNNMDKKAPSVPAGRIEERTALTKERPVIKEGSNGSRHRSSSTPDQTEEKTAKVSTKSRHSSEPAGKQEIRLRQDLPITDGRLLMALSYIVNPNEFYVHLITPEAIAIDELYDRLQKHYDQEENLVEPNRFKDLLEVDDFCCARFEKQPGWYRGKIVEVRQVGPGGCRKRDFRVFYVDYGDTEWVLESDLQPLDASFYEPPAQVVKCSLAYIRPKRPAEIHNNKAAKWSDQAIKTFTKLTGYLTKLYGYVTSIPTDMSKPIEVNLSISTPHMELYLNQELVNLDLASSDILKKETEEDTELEVSSAKWLESQSGGEGDSDTGLPDSPHSLMDVLEKLDPMAIHFNAEINTYGFDRDDPEMATMGYKRDNNLCFYHISGRGCDYGDSCKYEHPDLGRPGEEGKLDGGKRKRAGRKLPKCIRHHAVHQWLGIPCPAASRTDTKRAEASIPHDIRETTPCYCINNVVELPPKETVVVVLVTAIHSPVHFWVQFLFGPRALDQLKIECSKSLERPWESGETLESLNENINQTCGKSSSNAQHNMTIPALGEIVLARYSKDKKWYRARVTSAEEDKIEVFHVDYGTSDRVSKKDIQPPLPQFLHLPFQAVQCRLHGLQESQACEGETKNARNYFEEVATGVPMVAYIVERGLENLLYVDLYNTSTEEDICMNQKLVEKGFYRPAVEKQEKVS